MWLLEMQRKIKLKPLIKIKYILLNKYIFKKRTFRNLNFQNHFLLFNICNLNRVTLKSNTLGLALTEYGF